MCPRVMCSPPRPESAHGSPHGPGVRRGPTWMRVIFAFIPFCSRFGNGGDCGLGTFSEYSQVCSHEAERERWRESPLVVPRRGGHRGTRLLTPGNQAGSRCTLPRTVEGRVGASSWHLGPGRPPGRGHASSQSHGLPGLGPPPRGTLRAGTSGGLVF